MTRRAFYSFHYELDNWRASQIRNMGVVDGNRPATDNDIGRQSKKVVRPQYKNGLMVSLRGNQWQSF